MARSALALVALLVTGCAGILPSGQTSRIDKGGIAAPCLPEGVPPYADWIAHEAALLQVKTNAGGQVAGAYVGYVARGHRFAAVWVGDALMALDPAPDDPNVPMLHDEGLATRDGRWREGGEATCRWAPFRRGGESV